MIRIYSKDDVIRYNAIPSDKSTYSKELMAQEGILLSFTTEKIINITRGDYIKTRWGKFIVQTPEKPTQDVNTGGYSYEQMFVAPYCLWQNRIIKFWTTYKDGEGRDLDTPKEVSFKLTQVPSYFMELVTKNLLQEGYGNFTFDVDASLKDMKFIAFDNISIFDALTKIAEAWDTEWWITDNVIHLSKCSYGDAVRFARNEAAESFEEQDSDTKYITRLYAFGSTRNLPQNYRKNRGVVVEGIVERRLKLPEGTDYVDAYPEMKQEDVVEGVMVNDEIFPKSEGIISEVSTQQYTETKENEDGTTTDEKWNAYRFKDQGFLFKKDYMIDGEELRVVFQTGKMAGMDFAVSFNPDGKPEAEASAQIFEIIRSDEYGINLPSDTFHPEVGDKYILYGFDTSFIDSTLVGKAEKALLEAAKKEIEKRSRKERLFTARTNRIWCAGYRKKNGELVHTQPDEIDFNVGQQVMLVDDILFPEGKVTRVRGYEKKLNNIYDCEYTFGDGKSYSKTGELSEKIEELTLQAKGFTPSGGSSIYLIKRYDSSKASDFNAYSAARSDMQYLSKNKEDQTTYRIGFMDGLNTNDVYSINKKGEKTYKPGGTVGAGFGLYTGKDGDTYLEVDNIVARKKFEVTVLDIQKETFSAGNINLTNANGTVYRVYGFDASGYNYINIFVATNEKNEHVTLAAFDKEHQLVLGSGDKDISGILGKASFYKVYFAKTDDKVVIEDLWHNGDMALCKDLNLTEETQRSWHRVVTSHGIDILEDGKPYNYIVVSNSDEPITVRPEHGREDGSDDVSGIKAYDSTLLNSEPVIGDKVVQCGSVTELDRTGLTRLDSRGDGNGGMYVCEGIGMSRDGNKQFQPLSVPIVITPNRIYLSADELELISRDDHNRINGSTNVGKKMSKIEMTANGISLSVANSGTHNLFMGSKELRADIFKVSPISTGWGEPYKDFASAGVRFVPSITTADHIDLLQYCGVSLEPSTIYTLSFMYYGTIGSTMEFFIHNTEGKRICKHTYSCQNLDYDMSIDGHQTITVEKEEWQKGWITFETEKDLTEDTKADFILARLKKLIAFPNTAYICAPKLEVGPIATAWRPNDNDIDVKLFDTGIDLREGVVTITTTNFIVRNNLGEPTALLDENGKLSIKVLDANRIITEALNAKQIVVNDARISGLILTGDSRLGNFMLDNGDIVNLKNNKDYLVKFTDKDVETEIYEDRISKPLDAPLQEARRGYFLFNSQIGEVMDSVIMRKCKQNGDFSLKGHYVSVTKTPALRRNSVHSANNAYYVESGTFAGLRPVLRNISARTEGEFVQLDKMDYTVFLHGTNTINVRLPSKKDVQQGQRIEIRTCGAVKNNITADAAISDGSSLGANQMRVYMYDEDNEKWWVNKYN